MRCTLIANPAAGRGEVAARWDEFVEDVRSALGPVDVVRTEAAGHAVTLAERAVHDGSDVVLSLGGDGTHHEVVNGVMRARAGGVERQLRFGALPAGTGGDFCRLYPVERTVRAVARHLAEGGEGPLDVGHVAFRSDADVADSRWFLNICSTGVGGLVDRYVAQARARIGGRLAYYLASLRASAVYRSAVAELIVDGASVGVHRLNSIAVCNGRWFGGGMMIAPHADPGDGLLDVVLVPHITPARVVSLSRTVYRGAHLELPFIEHWRASRVDIRVKQHTAWMDIDGEAPGIAPCTMTLVPGALTLLGTTR